MNVSNQNNQPTTSSSVMDDSNLTEKLLEIGFTRLPNNYKCLVCDKKFNANKDFGTLTKLCTEHLIIKHKNLKNKKLNYWKKMEAKDLLKRKSTPRKGKPKLKQNEKEFFYKICQLISKSCYPRKIYNDLIKNIFEISGQTNVNLLSANNDDVKTAIANMETDIEKRIIDCVKASKYYYFKLFTVNEKHVIFVSFFFDNQLYEEVLFLESDLNGIEPFFSFINENQIDLKKCLGICYYKKNEWIPKIRAMLPSNSMSIKINLNVYDLMVNITLSKPFSSLISRINKFKSSKSNFDLLTSDLTDDECELLRNSNQDWLNISQILRNFCMNRQRFTFNSSTSTSTASGTLSDLEIIYCAFVCDVCKRLEELRKNCNSNNVIYKKSIEKIINLLEVDARNIESGTYADITISTLGMILQTSKLSDKAGRALKDCLLDICNICKQDYLDEAYDWILDPFAKNTHQSAPAQLGYDLVNLKSDFALQKEFNAIDDFTATNILKFWHDIENPDYAKLQKSALERLLFVYNTNIYDKMTKILLEMRSHTLEDLHLRLKFSQFEPNFSSLPDIFNTNNGEPEQSMIVD